MQMVKSEIATKNSTPKRKVSKSRTIEGIGEGRTWVDFVNKDQLLLFPGRDQFRQRFIQHLLTWSERDDALDILGFCLMYKIPRSTLYDWRDMYPDVKDALDNVSLFIGYRKRLGALKKDFDKEVAFRDMHALDPEWDKINRYHAELKQQYQVDTPSTYQFIMAPAPSTGMVPPLKKSGDKDEQ